jgi:dolichyl-phosphate-mannose-protein mannosyltransferase
MWYTWPFMTRPIYYWIKENARINLMGNPVLWWLSTIGALMVASHMLTGSLRRDRIAWILLGGYVLNLLPFIGIKRVMFMYHYLTALIFAILMLAYIIDKISKKPQRTFAIIGALSVLSFIYFAPIMYGQKLSPQQYEQRVWLRSWR